MMMFSVCNFGFLGSFLPLYILRSSTGLVAFYLKRLITFLSIPPTNFLRVSGIQLISQSYQMFFLIDLFFIISFLPNLSISSEDMLSGLVDKSSISFVFFAIPFKF